TNGWADNHYDGEPQFPAKKIYSDLASEDNEAFRVALRWTPNNALAFDYSYDNTANSAVETPFQVTAVKSSLYDGFTTTPFDFQTLGGSMYTQMANTIGDPTQRREDYELDAV